MLPAQQETFSQSQNELSLPAEPGPVERQIITHRAWQNMQQKLHQYAEPDNDQKINLLPELTNALNQLFKLMYQLVDFNALLQAVTLDHFSGNSIARAEIVNDELMVLEALTVFGRYPSVLEDLPGQSGLYISMDQAVIINQYTECKSAISEQCAISKLSRVLCTNLDARSALAFEPENGNIVDMQSLANKSIVLCIRYQNNPRHSAISSGHIYYPITTNHDEQESFFARQVPRYG